MNYDGLKEKKILEKQKIYGLNEQINQNKYNILYEAIIYFLLILIILNLINKNFIESILFLTLLIIKIVLMLIINKKNKNKKEKHEKNFYYTVIRERKQNHVHKSKVVVGDIIIYKKSNEICADSMILESKNLIVDESIYNKNSYAIEKNENYVNINRNLKSNYLYTGSVVLSGYAVCKVIGTGFNTEYSKLIRDNKICDEYMKKENRYLKIYLLTNIISSLLFLFGITFNNTLLISISFIICTDFMHLFLNYFSTEIIVKLANKNIYIENIKYIYEISNSKNLLLTQNEVNGHKIKLKEIHAKTFDKNKFIKHAYLAISNKYIKNELNYGNKEEFILLKSYKQHKLNFNIYKNKEKLYLFVSGNIENIFDICPLDLDYKYNLNIKEQENYVDGVKLIGVGHQIIKKIEDDIFKYNINFDGYICVENYYDDGIYDNLNILSNYYNLYIFMDDNKYYSREYFKNVNVINNQYVIGKKDFESLNDKQIYENLKDINIYSKFNTKMISRLYHNFPSTIIFNNSNKYYIENNDLANITDFCTIIKSIIKNIKIVLLVILITLLSLIILSLFLNYIYIILIKYVLLVLNFYFIKKCTNKL